MAKPLSRRKKSWYGWAVLAFGCYLEFVGLESVHEGLTNYAPTVWACLFLGSLVFILLGLLVIWRESDLTH